MPLKGFGREGGTCGKRLRAPCGRLSSPWAQPRSLRAPNPAVPSGARAALPQQTALPAAPPAAAEAPCGAPGTPRGSLPSRCGARGCGTARGLRWGSGGRRAALREFRVRGWGRGCAARALGWGDWLQSRRLYVPNVAPCCRYSTPVTQLLRDTTNYHCFVSPEGERHDGMTYCSFAFPLKTVAVRMPKFALLAARNKCKV